MARGLGTFLSNLSDEFFCVMDGTYFVCSLFFYAARASCQRRRSLEAARPLVHSNGLTPLRAALRLCVWLCVDAHVCVRGHRVCVCLRPVGRESGASCTPRSTCVSLCLYPR